MIVSKKPGVEAADVADAFKPRRPEEPNPNFDAKLYGGSQANCQRLYLNHTTVLVVVVMSTINALKIGLS